MIYQKNPGMVARKIMDEVILVPVRKNVADMKSIYTLNETGAKAWELIDGKNEVDDIVRAIVEEHEVEAAKAKADVETLIAQLKEVGAIEERQ